MPLLEEWVTKRFGARRVLLTDSGTSALSLAMMGGLGPVALPAYGCFDLATAADGADASILLYDLNPRTLNPDPASLRAALDRGAAVIVVAHFFGIPAAIPAAIGNDDVLVIEDAAQAIGGRLAGQPLGSQGSLSVLSFGRGKGLTGGGGGALLALDERGIGILHQEAPKVEGGGPGFGLWVRSVGQWMLSRPSLYRLPTSLPFLGLGETPYHKPHSPGRMSRASAGLVMEGSRLLDRELEQRRANARRLLAQVQPGSDIQPIEELPTAQPGYLRLPLVVSPRHRQAAAADRAREMGIMPGYPTPLNRLRGFEGRVLNRSDPFPGAELLAERLITLPVHSLLREQDLIALEQWISRQ